MKKIILTFIVFIIFALIIIAPDVCINGASSGLLICGNVIIPALFPFSVFVIFLLNCDVIKNFSFIEILSKKIFNQTSDMFFTMLFSMLGGYPIGARLINQLFDNNKISKNDAHIMQCYCVNAGPAFIAVAIGEGILHSKKIGLLMLIAHIFASFIIATLLKSRIKHNEIKCISKTNTNEELSEIFVSSTSQAASSILSICSFAILFSVINEYLCVLSNRFSIIKILTILCEVTTSVAKVKNIYLISFLLGFSGFAVWFQIIACSRSCGLNLPLFIVSRITHGGLSSLILYILTILFKINVQTVSNINIDSLSYDFNNIKIVFSLTIMVIMLIISLNGKNRSRKILDDVL